MSTTIHPATILGPVPTWDELDAKAKAPLKGDTQAENPHARAVGRYSVWFNDALSAMERAMQALDRGDTEWAYTTLYDASRPHRGEIPNPAYVEEPDRHKEAVERDLVNTPS